MIFPQMSESGKVTAQVEIILSFKDWPQVSPADWLLVAFISVKSAWSSLVHQGDFTIHPGNTVVVLARPDIVPF